MDIEQILFQLKDGYSLTEIVENPIKEKFIIGVLKDYAKLKNEMQENKALTLSELKEMIGEPVWCFNTEQWCLIADVIGDSILCISEIDDKNGCIDSATEVYPLVDFIFYKHKPKG